MTGMGRPELPGPTLIVQPAASVRLSVGAASGLRSSSAGGWAASAPRSAPILSGRSRRQASGPAGATAELGSDLLIVSTGLPNLRPALCRTGAEPSAVDSGR